MSTIIAYIVSKLGLTRLIINLATYVLKRWVLKVPTDWTDLLQVRTFLRRGLPTLVLVASKTTDFKVDDMVVAKLQLIVNNDVAFSQLWSVLVQDISFVDEEERQDRRRRIFKRFRKKDTLSDTNEILECKNGLKLTEDDLLEVSNAVISLRMMAAS